MVCRYFSPRHQGKELLRNSLRIGRVTLVQGLVKRRTFDSVPLGADQLPCGIAHHGLTGRHVLGDDRSCSDLGMCSDTHTRKDDRTGTDGGVLLHDGLRPVGRGRVLVVGEGHSGTDETGVADDHSGRDEREGLNLDVIPDDDIIPDPDVGMNDAVLADDCPLSEVGEFRLPKLGAFSVSHVYLLVKN